MSMNRNTTYKAYHGTHRRFDRPTDFSKLKGIDFGPGFYFSTDRRDAETYGENVYEAQVRVDHPIVVSLEHVDNAFVTRFARALGATAADVQLGLDEGGVHPVAVLFELARTLVDVGTFTPASLRKFLINLGYDGVVVDPDVVNALMSRGGSGRRMHGQYVAVFSPDQILSWDLTSMRRNAPRAEECARCRGTGQISRFSHIHAGVCFECKGTGMAPKRAHRRTSFAGEALSPAERAKLTIDELRTSFRNFDIARREGRLGEFFELQAESAYENDLARGMNPEPITSRNAERRGMEAWNSYVQILIDDLRRLGADEKADDIASKFRDRLGSTVKNPGKRRSSRRTSKLRS